MILWQSYFHGRYTKNASFKMAQFILWYPWFNTFLCDLSIYNAIPFYVNIVFFFKKNRLQYKPFKVLYLQFSYSTWDYYQRFIESIYSIKQMDVVLRYWLKCIYVIEIFFCRKQYTEISDIRGFFFSNGRYLPIYESSRQGIAPIFFMSNLCFIKKLCLFSYWYNGILYNIATLFS